MPKTISTIDRLRWTILMSVILALCFSAGEGLRLMPFSADYPCQVTADQSEASWESDPVRYGPVDLPQTSAAKNQFKIVRLHSLRTDRNADHPAQTSQYILLTKVVTIPTGPSICQPRDRAPPR